MAEDLDNEFDDDLDMDFGDDGLEMEFDDPFASPPPPKDNREAITRSFKTGGAKFTEAIIDDPIASAADMVGAAIPSSISGEVNAAIDVSNTIKNEYKDGIKVVKAQLKPTLLAVEKIIPKGGAAEKLMNFAKSKLELKDEDAAGVAETEAARMTAEAMAGVTDALGEQQDKQTALDLIKDQIVRKRDMSALQVAATSATNLEAIHKFNIEVTNAYYRKSLELQYRQLYTTGKQLETTKTGFETFSNQLENIVANTALPDILKERKSEKLKEVLLKGTFDNLFGNDSVIGNIKKNITDKMKNTVSGIVGGLGMTAGAAEMVGMGQETSGMTGGAAGAIGSEAASFVKKKIGGLAGKYLASTAGGSAAVSKFSDFMMDPAEAARRAAEETEDDSVAKKAMHIFAEFTQNDNKEQRFSIDKIDKDERATFDGRVKTSITKIIPGLLSKILKEVSSIRSGNDEDELRFDYETNDFATKNSLKENVRESVKKSLVVSGVSGDIDTLIEGVVNDSDIGLGPEEVAKLKEGIISYSLTNKPLVPNLLAKNGFYEFFPKELGEKLQSGMEQYLNPPDQDISISRNRRLNGTLTQIRNNAPSPSELLKMYEDSGSLDILRDDGLVDRDETTGDHVLNQERYKELLAGVIGEETTYTAPEKSEEKRESGVSGIADLFDIKRGKLQDGEHGPDLPPSGISGFAGGIRSKFSNSFNSAKDGVQDKYNEYSSREGGTFKAIKDDLSEATSRENIEAARDKVLNNETIKAARGKVSDKYDDYTTRDGGVLNAIKDDITDAATKENLELVKARLIKEAAALKDKGIDKAEGVLKDVTESERYQKTKKDLEDKFDKGRDKAEKFAKTALESDAYASAKDLGTKALESETAAKVKKLKDDGLSLIKDNTPEGVKLRLEQIGLTAEFIKELTPEERLEFAKLSAEEVIGVIGKKASSVRNAATDVYDEYSSREGGILNALKDDATSTGKKLKDKYEQTDIKAELNNAKTVGLDKLNDVVDSGSKKAIELVNKFVSKEDQEILKKAYEADKKYWKGLGIDGVDALDKYMASKGVGTLSERFDTIKGLKINDIKQGISDKYASVKETMSSKDNILKTLTDAKDGLMDKIPDDMKVMGESAMDRVKSASMIAHVKFYTANVNRELNRIVRIAETDPTKNAKISPMVESIKNSLSTLATMDTTNATALKEYMETISDKLTEVVELVTPGEAKLVAKAVKSGEEAKSDEESFLDMMNSDDPVGAMKRKVSSSIKNAMKKGAKKVFSIGKKIVMKDLARGKKLRGFLKEKLFKKKEGGPGVVKGALNKGLNKLGKVGTMFKDKGAKATAATIGASVATAVSASMTKVVSSVKDKLKDMNVKKKVNPFDRDGSGKRDGSWMDRIKGKVGLGGKKDDKKGKGGILSKVKDKAKDLLSPTNIMIGIGVAMAAMNVTMDDVKGFMKGMGKVFSVVKKVAVGIWDGIKSVGHYMAKAFFYLKNLPNNITMGLRSALSKLPMMGGLAPSKKELADQKAKNAGTYKEPVKDKDGNIVEQPDAESEGSSGGEMAAYGVAAAVGYKVVNNKLTRAVGRGVKAVGKGAYKVADLASGGKLGEKVKSIKAKLPGKSPVSIPDVNAKVKAKPGKLKNGLKKLGSKALSAGKDALAKAKPKAGGVIKMLKGFKGTIMKKFGKKAGKMLAAKLTAKLAARLVPFLGAGLLAYDAGMIGYDVFHNDTPLKSAISKQILGFDLFGDDPATDEDGNLIKPDEPEVPKGKLIEESTDVKDKVLGSTKLDKKKVKSKAKVTEEKPGALVKKVIAILKEDIGIVEAKRNKTDIGAHRVKYANSIGSIKELIADLETNYFDLTGDADHEAIMDIYGKKYRDGTRGDLAYIIKHGKRKGTKDKAGPVSIGKKLGVKDTLKKDEMPKKPSIKDTIKNVGNAMNLKDPSEKHRQLLVKALDGKIKIFSKDTGRNADKELILLKVLKNKLSDGDVVDLTDAKSIKELVDEYGTDFKKYFGVSLLEFISAGSFKAGDDATKAFDKSLTPKTASNANLKAKGEVKESSWFDKLQSTTAKVFSYTPVGAGINAIKSLFGSSPASEEEPKDQNIVSEKASVSGITTRGGPKFDAAGGIENLALAKGVTVDGLNPVFANNLSAMANEYFDLTGKKMPINSGFRSYAYQAALKKKYGAKAASPGKSTHEFGLAIDTNTTTADELDELGLMAKYGFTRPVGMETWHVESAGAQLDVNGSKKDQGLASELVKSGEGKGGAGWGTLKGKRKYSRNKEYQEKLLSVTGKPASEKDSKPMIAANNNIASTKTNVAAKTEVKKKALDKVEKPEIASIKPKADESIQSPVADLDKATLSPMSKVASELSTVKKPNDSHAMAANKILDNTANINKEQLGFLNALDTSMRTSVDLQTKMLDALISLKGEKLSTNRDLEVFDEKKPGNNSSFDVRPEKVPAANMNMEKKKYS